MTTVAAVMDGVAAALPAGLRVYARPPLEVEVPCGVVGYPEIDLNLVMGSVNGYELPVHVLVGRAVERTALGLVDGYITSVPAALNALAATNVKSAKVVTLTVAATDYLGVEFAVEVLA